MFSPDAAPNGAPSGSIRNPRRRRREDTDQPRVGGRKRSKIAQDTYEEVNGDGQTNGHVEPHKTGANMFLQDVSIPVRDRKPQTEHSQLWRSSKERKDEKNVLSKTVNYTVRHISPLPEDVVGGDGIPHAESFRGSLLSTNHSSYATAVTSDHVYIWDYTNGTAKPSSFRLALPVKSKGAESYPLSAVVASGSSSEVGLVLVYPSSGKVYYWENIDGIQALPLQQQRRQLLEGSVTGLLSRDTIEQLIEAESAGYLLLLSSGKLMHLTIRDAQGRPRIHASPLNSGASTGWLGGWTHALTRGWREKVCAVKTRPSATKGQVEVVSLNGNAILKTWEISWAGNDSFIAEHHALEEIRAALTRSQLLGPEGKQDFMTLDFAVIAQPHATKALITQSAARESTAHGLQAIVLVGIHSDSATHFALVELSMVSNTVHATRLIPIIFETANTTISNIKARLLVPKPERTAFVVLEDQVFVISLKEEESKEEKRKKHKGTDHEVNPDEQLRMEVFGPELPYQDILHFRKDKGATIETAAIENLSRHLKHEPDSIALIVRSTGVVRIVATDPDIKIESKERFQITAKARLEQAIFYGTDPESILDFTHVSDFNFPLDQVEEAAIALSREIIDTRTRYLPTTPGPSMDAHFDIRAKALRDLISFLNANYPPLSRKTRWQLLWDAEKLCAARGIWQVYEKQMQVNGDHGEPPFLEHLMLALQEKYKEPLQPELGQVDAVRQWFTKDVSRVDRIHSNSAHALLEPIQRGVSSQSEFLHMAVECEELWFAAFESAYSFREDTSNQELYGLLSEDWGSGGILKSGYTGLDEFWTARTSNANAVRQCTHYFRKTAVALLKAGKQKRSVQASTDQLAQYQPRLLRICCLMNTERYRWNLEQEDDEHKATGESIKQDYETRIAHEEIAHLASLGQGEAGMKLAEELGEVPALVDLVLSELVRYTNFLDDTQAAPADQANMRQKILTLQSKVQKYFKVFGTDFATAFYAAQIRERQLGDLLSKKYGNPQQLTQFLRNDSSRAKLSWINDILNEDDQPFAARALIIVAEDQEHNVWAKKIELALAKNAILVAQDASEKKSQLKTLGKKSPSEVDDELSNLLANVQRGETIVEIQEKLYKHVRPIILTALDDAGAMDTIMSTYGDHLKERPHLQALLRRSFEQLLKHEVMASATLIDVLTLMDHIPSESAQNNIAGEEFLYALTLLSTSHLSNGVGEEGNEGDMIARLLWKRAYVFDDWKALNNSAGKSDLALQGVLMDTALFSLFKNGEKHSLLDTEPAYHVYVPTECVGAGSQAADFDPRFPEADIREGLAKDNARDDKTLQEYLKSHRLDHWVTAVRKLAQQAVAEDTQRRIQEEEAFMNFEEVEFEEPPVEREEPEELDDLSAVEEYPGDPEDLEDGFEEGDTVLNGVEERYDEADDADVSEYIDEGEGEDHDEGGQYYSGGGETEEGGESQEEYMMHGGAGYSGDEEDVEMTE